MANMVLWNKEMNQCIGFALDMDKVTFEKELRRTYLETTGKELETKALSLVCIEMLWIFTNFESYTWF